MTRVRTLRTQFPAGLIGVPAEPVRLSWALGDDVDAGSSMVRIDASASPHFDTILASTSVPVHPQVAVIGPGPALRSREVRWFRARIEDPGQPLDDDEGWCTPVSVEVGLSEPSDWEGSFAAMPDDPGAWTPSPSPLLRREFCVDGALTEARLYVTSLGLHSCAVNGTAVASDLMAPGWQSYGQRLVACTHDVTSLIRPGPNALTAVLADGWYRGRLGWEKDRGRCRYGSQLGLLAQVELRFSNGDRTTISTSSEWRASTGRVRVADLYDGCEIDERHEPAGWRHAGFDDSEWSECQTLDYDIEQIEPWVSAPIRPIAVFDDVTTTASHDGTFIVDVGQNIAGFLEVDVVGCSGERVVVRHAEVLNPDGSLNVESLRTARATDEYTLATSELATCRPEFTFHGFRYGEITTAAEVRSVRAVAISSDLPIRSTFHCSHPGLVRLVENVRWSQRGNFVGLPTDCPQRDERLGWTGDAQAFASTSHLLLDCFQFWTSWFKDLALDQTDEGVPSVVPDVVLEGAIRTGRSGWADVVTIAPWAAFEATGDPSLVRSVYPSMRRWIATMDRKRGADGLLSGEFQYGDWLDPDAPPDRPWAAKTDRDFVANAFFAHSARLASRAATLVGDQPMARAFGQLAQSVAASTWRKWSEHALTTPTGCALAITFSIAPPEEHDVVGRALADLVDAAGGAIATGFLGTPLILPALSQTGHVETAYRALLRSAPPSWLYQVEMGATTVWERWQLLMPDGSIVGSRAGSPDNATADEEPTLLSFNHYAYGAVVAWIFRHVGGLAPVIDDPGYRTTLLAPRPCESISDARLQIDSSYGPVSIEWRVESDLMTADVFLPVGTCGLLDLPTTANSVVTVDGQPHGGTRLESGSHRITVSETAIARPIVETHDPQAENDEP